MCMCRNPTTTPNTRDCFVLMQIPFWTLVTVLYTWNVPPVTKCCLVCVQCPLQPLSDVLCICTSLSGHKGLSCAHAVPLLSTRCCLVLTNTLSKLVCGSGNYIPGGLTSTSESGQTGSLPGVCQGKQVLLERQGLCLVSLCCMWVLWTPGHVCFLPDPQLFASGHCHQ